jgi:type II secretory pathway pseudopilin PulG
VPAVSARLRRDESGFTVIEVLVASSIALTMLVSASIGLTASNSASNREVTQGTTTNQAIIDAEALQTYLSGAWTSGSLAGVSTQCSNGPNGPGNSFPSGQGPFVTATGTDLMFCAFRNNSPTSYTYEIHFSNCDTKHVCTLKIDQAPAPGCTTCKWNNLVSAPGVSSQGATVGGVLVAPFVYYYFDTATSTWQTTTALNQIQAVQVTFNVSGSTGSGTSVQRLITLPNTIAGGS